MTKEQILNGNKLIAEFMWWDIIEPSNSSLLEQSIKHTQYHRSFDWLMPVAEKIEQLGHQTFNLDGKVIDCYSRFEIKHNRINLSWSHNHGYQLYIETQEEWRSGGNVGLAKEYKRINIKKETTKLEALWLIVVEFIRWYNLNNK